VVVGVNGETLKGLPYESLVGKLVSSHSPLTIRFARKSPVESPLKMGLLVGGQEEQDQGENGGILLPNDGILPPRRAQADSASAEEMQSIQSELGNAFEVEELRRSLAEKELRIEELCLEAVRAQELELERLEKERQLEKQLQELVQLREEKAQLELRKLQEQREREESEEAKHAQKVEAVSEEGVQTGAAAPSSPASSSAALVTSPVHARRFERRFKSVDGRGEQLKCACESQRVPAGGHFMLPVQADHDGSLFELTFWVVEPEGMDIGFQLLRPDKRYEAQFWKAKIEYFRESPTKAEPETFSLTLDKGEWVLQWDNSYSWMNEKYIGYSFTVTEPLDKDANIAGTQAALDKLVPAVDTVAQLAVDVEVAAKFEKMLAQRTAEARTNGIAARWRMVDHVQDLSKGVEELAEAVAASALVLSEQAMPGFVKSAARQLGRSTASAAPALALVAGPGGGSTGLLEPADQEEKERLEQAEAAVRSEFEAAAAMALEEIIAACTASISTTGGGENVEGKQLQERVMAWMHSAEQDETERKNTAEEETENTLAPARRRVSLDVSSSAHAHLREDTPAQPTTPHPGLVAVVSLDVGNDEPQRESTPAHPTTPHPDSKPMVYNVKLEKTVDSKLGLQFQKPADAIVVTKITPGGLADASGKIKLGDELLKVNGWYAEGQPLKEVRLRLHSAHAAGIAGCPS
jgi:hypothetical protein